MADRILSLIIPSKIDSRMNDVVKREGLLDQADLIKKSLATYDKISALLRDGCKIVIQYPNAEESEFKL